jgi:NTP pyrophosphatase (non-canonical NTP hydrolase)
VTPYDRVKLSRERTSATFPFPALRPSLDYTICEFAGELRDAVLRDERCGDVRNTDRAHSQRAELGDAFYMLLSACIQADHEPILRMVEASMVEAMPPRRCCNLIVRLLTQAADAADMLAQFGPSECELDALHRMLDSAYTHMVALCVGWYDWPVADVVDEACAKFERKHAAVQEGAQ